jgi:hypothetical protein
MGVQFLTGAIAGSAATSLLNSNKQPTIVHNHIYVPLTEAQANLYLNTEEYLAILNQTCKSSFLYIDTNNKYKPRLLNVINTDKTISVTLEEAFKLVEREKVGRKANDKITLQTKGINGIIKYTVGREKSLCDMLCFYIFCGVFCLPCIIKDCCDPNKVNLDNGSIVVRIPEQTYQYLLTLRK